MATPFMALTLPTPSVSTGPGWASTLNTALTTVDSHDHTTGKGVQVPISGLNINADLNLNPTGGSGPFNLTGLRSSRYVSQSAALAVSTDTNCVYFSGGNFYINNSSGQAVQITSGSTLSATSLGGISGLPSGTASASFGSQTFTWRSATNTAASMDGGPVLIRDTALGASAITIQSPVGIASPYTLSLPSALPASNLPLSLSNGGALTAAQITTAQIANSAVGSTQIAANGVARSNLVAVGQQASSSCGLFNTTSAAFVDITNLTITITTTGRPVVLVMQSDGGGNVAQIDANPGSGNQIRFLRGATEIARYYFSATTGDPRIPGAFFIDVPAAGTYTYKLQAISDGVNTFAIQHFVLFAYEL